MGHAEAEEAYRADTAPSQATQDQRRYFGKVTVRQYTNATAFLIPIPIRAP